MLQRKLFCCFFPCLCPFEFEILYCCVHFILTRQKYKTLLLLSFTISDYISRTVIFYRIQVVSAVCRLSSKPAAQRETSKGERNKAQCPLKYAPVLSSKNFLQDLVQIQGYIFLRSRPAKSTEFSELAAVIKTKNSTSVFTSFERSFSGIGVCFLMLFPV